MRVIENACVSVEMGSRLLRIREPNRSEVRCSLGTRPPDSAIASRVQHALSLCGSVLSIRGARRAADDRCDCARSYALGERTITRECARRARKAHELGVSPLVGEAMDAVQLLVGRDRQPLLLRDTTVSLTSRLLCAACRDSSRHDTHAGDCHASQSPLATR